MPLNGSDLSILAEAARLFAAASHVKLLGVSTVTCLSPVLAVWQARASQDCFRPHADVAFFVGAVQRVLTCGSRILGVWDLLGASVIDRPLTVSIVHQVRDVIDTFFHALSPFLGNLILPHAGVFLKFVLKAILHAIPSESNVPNKHHSKDHFSRA